MARYYSSCDSDPVERVVSATSLPKPDSISGFAPDAAAILTWAPPWIKYDGPALKENREVGDVLRIFTSPSPVSSCYGICDDGTGLWITDPTYSATTIFRITYDGILTGETIDLFQGQSWIGDMVSDGTYLYCCLIGGTNRIGKVYLPTGQIVGTIGGDFSETAQMGLAADFENEEFYIGGWNSNMIWRTTFSGNTISTHTFDNVSGLAWSPQGGPNHEGSLWVMVNAYPNWVSEIDPNENWGNMQSFMIPGGEANSGAGIELKSSGYYGQKALWICNQIENKVFLVDLEDVWIGSPWYRVPENLIGFNIYKNGEFLDYIEYSAPDSCSYVDPVSWSEYYEGSVLKYEITAVYDMTPYGFPGETGESPPDGPAEIYLPYYWLELDFLEDWSSGTFEDNAWYITDSSWTIDQELGNEAPCAVFITSAPQTGYEATLESFRFLDNSSDDIILEYDVVLSSNYPTGNELLLIQVFDYTNKTWNTISEITNGDGSFDWRRDSMNIAGDFNAGAFRIRFNATGENSSDINYWAIDNISLTRICPAPDSIDAEILPPTEDSILVSWEEPSPPIAEWKQYDDGVYFNSIGFGTEKNSWFSLAVRWTPDLLVDMKGAFVTAVGFIPGSVSACFQIALWSGDDLMPFYTQAAGNLTAYQYNIFQLDQPQPIDITKDLFVGYKLSTYCNYPISVDNGPAFDSLGNMFRFGSGGPWTTLLEANPMFDWNLNIKAFFERDGVQYESYYGVYRSIDGSEPVMIAETMEENYTDPVGNGIGTYCYNVQALYYNGCESDFSPEACILLTEIPVIDQEDEGTLKIYPNPASNELYIESEQNIEIVTIFDSRGITIEQWNSGQVVGWSGGRVVVPVDGFPPGLYLVRVESAGGVVAKKVVIGW